METKETHISPWLHSIQHSFRTHGLFTAIDESVIRVRNTREKINSLMDKVLILESELAIPIGSYHERISDMVAIRDAIGVYRIYHPTHKRRMGSNVVWHTYDPFVLSDYKEGSDWLDYFGQDDRITDVGGYITVSLSDSGILYLNSIWEGVSSLSSSYDDTTVAT